MSDSEPGSIYIHDPIPYRVIIVAIIITVGILYLLSVRMTEPGRLEFVFEYCDNRGIDIELGMGGFLKYRPPVIMKDTFIFLQEAEINKPDIIYYDAMTASFWFYNHTSRKVYILSGVEK